MIISEVEDSSITESVRAYASYDADKDPDQYFMGVMLLSACQPFVEYVGRRRAYMCHVL